MTKAQRPELSSVFDDMLVQSKRRFDDLYQGARTRADSHSTAPSMQLDADSSVVRWLDERFGKDWRYEISGQQRDGDEAIVLCKLIVGREGAIREQFGRAKINAGPTVGASGGVRFKVGRVDAEQTERDAFRRATEAALKNCIDLI